MSKIYEKWRELEINPLDIKFKIIKIKQIISYPPAGNDVIECICNINNKEENVFIKIERSKVCDFISEANNIKYLYNNNYYLTLPLLYEQGLYNDKNYLVLSKIQGERLSDILNKDISNKEKYLYNYGKELSVIHQIPIGNLKIAKQRIINEFPNNKIYTNITKEKEITNAIKFLRENNPNKELNTFIHGDFHYGNILWNNNKIVGVLDWEYSGKGFKEQDIAWSCILRPGQKFMNTISDIETFLKGYREHGTYDNDKLKWCLLNGYCHFYLMNENNVEYRKQLLNLINIVMNFK